jgi:hypothetical protein
MPRTLRTLCLILALTLASSGLTAPAGAADKDEGFTDLFNGKDFSGLKFEVGKSDPTKTWSVKDGVIICTGKPSGYFYTDKPYKNYHLKFEVRYAKPATLTDDSKFGGNSGVLIHITGDQKIWPKCVEAQGMNRDMGNLFAISGAKGSFKKNAEDQKKAIKPVGEWNVFEVISKDGELTTLINGVKVSEGKGDVTEGPIGFQSEGAEIHFKNLKIKEAK